MRNSQNWQVFLYNKMSYLAGNSEVMNYAGC